MQELDLYSILFWSRVLDRNVGAQPVQTKEDRAERDGKVIRLKLGTANVTTLYHEKREVWVCPLADFS